MPPFNFSMLEQWFAYARLTVPLWLWPAVDVFLQPRRDGKAAKRFFRRLLKRHGDEPRKIVTDKWGSYGVAHPGLCHG
jgi:transposase-like protein